MYAEVTFSCAETKRNKFSATGSFQTFREICCQVIRLMTGRMTHPGFQPEAEGHWRLWSQKPRV